MTESNEDSHRESERRDRRARNRKIGEKLRQIYDDVANEPAPDDFLKLLEDADDALDEEGRGA